MKYLSWTELFFGLFFAFAIYIVPLATSSTYWFYKTGLREKPFGKMDILQVFLAWCAAVILIIMLGLWYVQYYISIFVYACVNIIWSILLTPYAAFVGSVFIVFVLLSCIMYSKHLLKFSHYLYGMMFAKKISLVKPKPLIEKRKLIGIVFLSICIVPLSGFNIYLLDFFRDNFYIKRLVELVMYIISMNILWFFTCKYVFKLFRKIQSKLS